MIRLSQEQLLNLTIEEVQRYSERYAYLHKKNINDVRNEVIKLHLEALDNVKSKINHNVFDKLFNDKKK
jgi:hypothetical protein